MIRDGIKGGEVERAFDRANCPISRLIATRPEGYLTLNALRWLREVGVSFAALDYDGSPTFVSVSRTSSPVAASNRRRHALTTIETRSGRAIAVALIAAKIAGQAETLRRFPGTSPGTQGDAEQVTALAARINATSRADSLLSVEGMASLAYFNALADTELRFGKPSRGQGVPEGWRRLGSRRSRVTGRARSASSPGQALLNYITSVCVTEIVIACHAAGVDPALGVLHADKDGRASLAYDLLEPARPLVERWFLHWLAETTFAGRDFRTDLSGVVRVTHPLNSWLAMTAPLWRPMAGTLATWFMKALEGGKPGPLQLAEVDFARAAGRRPVRWKPGLTLERPISRTCQGCGAALIEAREDRKKKFCGPECAAAGRRERRARRAMPDGRGNGPLGTRKGCSAGRSS
jgi:CRISPR-associated protein Cas1